MKTKRYTICFESLETQMGSEIEISKKEFNRQLTVLKQRVITTQSNEYPVTMAEPRVYETEKIIETQYRFSCGCADVYLVEEICKEGYCFITKR